MRFCQKLLYPLSNSVVDIIWQGKSTPLYSPAASSGIR